MAKGFKSGGREKGTPNKISVQMKEVLTNYVESELNTLLPMVEELNTIERLNILTKLLPYIMPKAEYKEDTFRAPIEPITFRIIDKDGNIK